jgi:acyl-homoserine-lactone acylase
VQLLDEARVPVDAPLGDVQQADRNGTFVPVHGGNAADGTTNVVGFGRSWSILDPTLDEVEAESVAPGSALRTYTGPNGESFGGYPINSGTSFLFALAYDDEGPQARAFLTYGDTEDREADTYLAATESFSAKEWRAVPFTEDAVAAAAETAVRVQG